MALPSVVPQKISLRDAFSLVATSYSAHAGHTDRQPGYLSPVLFAQSTMEFPMSEI